MKVRWLAALLAGIMVIPLIAWGLERPDFPGLVSPTQVEPETLVEGPFDLFANNSSGYTTTAELELGREYRIQVQGNWKPDASAAHNADAGFETFDNWATTTQVNERGLFVSGVNFGRADPEGAYTGLSFRDDHNYDITWEGNGINEFFRVNDNNYEDNSGKLTIRIWTQKKVRWLYFAVLPIGSTPGIPQGSIFPGAQKGSILYESVEGVGSRELVNVPNQGLPVVGDVRIKSTSPCGGSSTTRQLTLVVTLMGVPQPIEVPLPLCYPATADLLHDRGAAAGGPNNPIVVSSPSVCYPNCEIFVPPVDLAPNPPISPLNIPGVSGGHLDVTISWRADTEHLWFSFVNDGTNDNIYVAPFDPRSAEERQWFLGCGLGIGACNGPPADLRATLNVTFYGPGGNAAGTNDIHIPGLGQILESIFYTKVNGK